MRRLAASVAVVALVLASDARAHPAFQPGFAPAGSESALELVIPNERRVPMTALELAAPPSVDLRAAQSTADWHGAVAGRRAVWTGARLPPRGIARVIVRLTPAGEAGTVTFRVRQRFVDGRAVNWPLALTVTPGSVGNGDGGLGAVAFAVVGVAGAASLLFVLWLRRRSGYFKRNSGADC